MQFYINSIPNDGDYVLAKIISFDDLGIKVSLPEYSNKLGYIIYNDSLKKKKNEINKYYKIGKEIIIEYLGVFDSELSFTDKYLCEDKKKHFSSFFSDYLIIYKAIKSFLKINKNIDVDKFLYSSLYSIDKYEVFSKYEHMIKESDIYSLNLDESTKELFLSFLKKKVQITNYSYKLKYEIRSINSFGINNIKNFFKDLHNCVNINISTYVYGIPYYIIEFDKYMYKEKLFIDIQNIKNIITSLSEKHKLIVKLDYEELVKQDLITN